MLSLTQKKDFERVAKIGQPFFAPELGFKMVKNNLSVNRYGIVVPVKIDKRATVRNLLKRRIKAVILANNNSKQGYDIMFLVRESVKNLNFSQIKAKIDYLFKKSGLI